MRILIAEDDMTSRLALARVLKKKGYDPVETVDGNEAWAALSAPDAPKLVILDWMMPGMDGLEVVRRVRALQSNPPPYIIFLTAKGGESVVEGLGTGANDYLNKPFNAEELFARVKVGQRMIETQDTLAMKMEALMKSERKHRALLETTSDLIFACTPEGQCEYANDAFATEFGKSVYDMIGRNLGDILPAGGKEKYLSILGHVCRTGEEQVLEISIPTIHDERWYLNTFTPIKDSAQKVISVLCSSKNITERKLKDTYRDMGREIMLALNETNGWKDSARRVVDILKIRTGFDAIGIRWQEGEDFPYVAQQGFPPAFSMTENSLVGWTVDGGVCRDEEGNIKLEGTCGLVISGKIDPANPLFSQGGSFWTNDSFQLLAIPPGEDPRFHPRNQCMQYKYASMALVPLRNKEKIIGLIHFNDRRNCCFTPDSVEILENIALQIGTSIVRRQIDEEKNKLQNQLIQAQKMESLGTLAGGIAHDFNNILTGILGYTDLAKMKCRDLPSVQRHLEEVTSAGIRAVDLVRQILTFSRRQEIELRPLHVPLVVKEVLKMLRSTLPSMVQLKSSIDNDVDPVLADPTQIHQIIMNLCVNASHAMEPNGGELTIVIDQVVLPPHYFWVHQNLLPGTFLRLQISDTGCGIAPENLDLIFEPYFTTKECGEGTGLGLAVVHGIVKQYGGDIMVDSTLGQGSTFTIYLPVINKQPDEPNMATEEIVKGQAERILVVDDELILCTFYHQFLEQLGYQITTSNNPLEALALFEQDPTAFDLVLTDVNMPGITGDKMGQRMMGIRPDLPVLLMTGHSWRLTDEQARELGFKGMMMKPVPAKALLIQLHEIFNEKKEADHEPSTR